MPQIDLDDLPPRVAQLLSGLKQGDELIIVQGGAVVARLNLAEAAAPEPGESLDDLAPEERIEEVMSQFNAMIHDEF
jgi:antitoxin (DNA-binding transcriptional repressor) of toxin-antitoxin stability system